MYVNFGKIGEGLFDLIIVGEEWSIACLELIIRFLTLLKKGLNQISAQDDPADHTPDEVLPVSKKLLPASASDTMSMCDNSMPPDFDDDISQTSSLIERDQLDPKKELLHGHHHHSVAASSPTLLDNSAKSITSLDKMSGEICYMIGARALKIEWGSTPRYWSWEAEPESRFPECAVLERVCHLQIEGKLHTNLLSPGINYGAYFVFKINSSGAGFKDCPVKVTISLFSEDGSARADHALKSYYLQAPDSVVANEMLPVVRDDGWMEIEMGTFQVSTHDAGKNAQLLEMTLEEVKRLDYWKNGLVVDGIELRPLLGPARLDRIKLN